MNIINHLRVFSRQSRSVFFPQDLNAIIQSALDMVQTQLRLHNIHVELNLAADLPKVTGDYNRLEQVFLNLITNARDAIQDRMQNEALETPETEKTAGHLVITTAISEKKGAVDVVVGDNGCGIPDAHVGKVFDPFFTTKPEGKGTGLGMSISYGIIKEHGGRIDVGGSGPDGTTLRVVLPTEEGG
jgi:C4-dicarboxylate-specific signal transduction histidine kinase